MVESRPAARTGWPPHPRDHVAGHGVEGRRPLRRHAGDHVDAVVAAIDAVDPGEGKVVLVGHSAAGAIAHAAADARPERVARVVYVGGFPAADGEAIADGFPAVNGEVPLPDWEAFADEDLVDLDDELRADSRRRAIPSPST